MKYRFFLILLTSMPLLAGCFSPHSIAPEFTLNTAISEEGRGKTVVVEVNDLRPEKEIIGYWGKPGSKNAPVKLAGSPLWSMTQKITEGLAAKGFGKEADGKRRQLTVNLQKLTYENRYDDIWRITLRIETELHTIVTNEKGKVLFEKDYDSRTEKRLLRAPSIESNRKYVGMTISDAINKLLADQQLIDKLAR